LIGQKVKSKELGNQIPTATTTFEVARPRCPRCGKEGSGTYTKSVKGYEYRYFAHREKGKIKWCYIGKA